MSSEGGRLLDTLQRYRSLKEQFPEVNVQPPPPSKRKKRRRIQREFGRGARHKMLPCGEDCQNCPIEGGPAECPYTDEDEDALLSEEYGKKLKAETGERWRLQHNKT